MSRPTTHDFEEFASRFVQHYWREIASHPIEFASHSDPCEKSTDELLAEIEFQTSIDIGAKSEGFHHLQMTNSVGDRWSFGFQNRNGQWKLDFATSGTAKHPTRINLLDDVYSPYFRPFLNRVIKNSMMPNIS